MKPKIKKTKDGKYVLEIDGREIPVGKNQEKQIEEYYKENIEEEPNTNNYGCFLILFSIFVYVFSGSSKKHFSL